MHIAIIGAGNIGQTLAYTLLYESYVDELSIADIVPEYSMALVEELRHSLAGMPRHIKINFCEKNTDIKNADLIVISAGVPRTPDMKDRSELVGANANVMKSIGQEMSLNHKGNKFVVITNPVDAMTMLFAKYCGADFVIGSGTSLDTLRFRSEISKFLNVPSNTVEGFVAGEHGALAVFLWSTVKINGEPLDYYLETRNLSLNKSDVEESVKEVSGMIIKNLGATKFGPAVAFVQLIAAIVQDTGEVLPCATPYGEIYLNIPLKLGASIGSSIEENLSEGEKEGLKKSAQAISETYNEALGML